jgi:hypothetical protein
MGLQVSREEIAGEWSLSFGDIDFVNAKPSGHGWELRRN